MVPGWHGGDPGEDPAHRSSGNARRGSGASVPAVGGGEIRMPQAKKAILAAHAIAKESDDPVLGAYAHAIGQGCGSVHCETHAIGMVIYALTALVRAHGLASCQEVIEARVREEEERLRVWQLREKQEKWTWAPFLMKERPNKELERKRKRQAAREG